MGHVKDLKTGIKYKDTPIGKIPVDWELVRLGDICSISSGGASNYSKDVNEKTYPVYGSNGILGSYDEFNFSDGLVIGRVGASGSIHMISSPVWASDNTLLLSITDRFAQKLFIYYYLQKCNLPGLATKTAQPLLTQQILKSVLIAKPNIYEQKKIADILTTVDEAIEKTDQVIEKTKEVKKGLMQKLLTCGIGHKKFKKTEIGEIPEEWEVMKLEEVCDEIYRYPTYYNIQYVEQDCGVPEVRGELIKDNGELPSDLSEYRYISKETSFKFQRTILHEGDFVLSVRGTMGKIGYIQSYLENANMTANLMRISPNREEVHPLWMKQFFMSDFFQRRLDAASSATTIKTIKAPELKEIELALPPFNEQKQIAAILSSVDEEVERETSHKEQLETLKKGLMQVLLMGKIRVS